MNETNSSTLSGFSHQMLLGALLQEWNRARAAATVRNIQITDHDQKIQELYVRYKEFESRLNCDDAKFLNESLLNQTVVSLITSINDGEYECPPPVTIFDMLPLTAFTTVIDEVVERCKHETSKLATE